MKFKRFMALAMAGVMTMAMAGTATAEVFNNDLSLTKEVTADNEVHSVEGTITFKLEDTDAFEVDTAEGKITPVAVDTLGFGENTTFSLTGFQKEEGAVVFSAASTEIHNKIKAAINSKDKPGVYYAKVHEETALATEAENYFGWTKIDSKYYYIAAFASLKETPADGDKYDIKYAVYEGTANGVTGEGKVSDLKFANTYNKDSGGDNASFTLEKKVTNPAYIAADQDYTFTLKITLPETAKLNGEGNAVCKATVTTENGTAAETITKSEETFSVTLKKDGKVSIADLPVGTKIIVTEDITNIKNNNYKSTAFTGAATDGTSEDENKKVSSEVTLGEESKNVVCTNTFNDITPTGLAVSVAPFIAMFVAVGAAIALYVAAKRRVR